MVHWHGNKIIMQHSFKQSWVAPPQIAKRWSRAEAKRVEISQPFMVKHYNQTMGGVDRMDHNVDKYRISIRSKKWWWSLFAFCADVSIQQAWHLYRTTPAAETKPLDLLVCCQAFHPQGLPPLCHTNIFVWSPTTIFPGSEQAGSSRGLI